MTWANALLVLSDILAWAIIHTVTGYAAHRLPAHRLTRDAWMHRPRGFERGGGFYRDTLAIHRWKDRVPEAGAIFAGGVSKRALPSLDDGGLLVFVRETRRAELGHWWALAASPVFALWNPPLAVVLLLGYAVASNLPCITIQRYNRLRLQQLIARRQGRARGQGREDGSSSV